MKRLKKKQWQLLAAAVVCLGCLVLAIVLLRQPSAPTLSGDLSAACYGVDVSSYQETIDWDTVAAQDIDFAFIKATEGSAHRDAYFAENWNAAREAGLFVGAYHFVSYDSSGEVQAKQFISTVPKTHGMLPPILDIEFYGDYEAAPPPADHVREIVDALVEALTDHYGQAPILYVNHESYNRYIAGRYLDCPIWICDLRGRPTLSDERSWTFWQYSHTAEVAGINGAVDRNVFFGTRGEFAAMFS